MNTQPLNSLGRRFRRVGVGLAVASAIAFSHSAAARVEGVTGPSFTLVAKADYISTADGGSVYTWGYALGTGTDCGAQADVQMQYPGPTLLVNQGDVVTITLCNQLPANTSLILPGQSSVTTAGGVVGKVTREARPFTPPASATNPEFADTKVTYTFVATNPGTYKYNSATQMNVQLEMGLFGALVVRPAGAPTQAYNHVATKFDREHLLVLSEMDPVWHDLVRDQAQAVTIPETGTGGATRNAYRNFSFSVNTANFPARNPNYWFINGRNGPDTMGEAFSPQLPAQPYNALPRFHPGEKLLLRVINAGRDLHPLHHHGNNTWTVGVDGRMLTTSPALGPNLARSDNTLRMLPGQTVDAFYEWTGKGLNWDIYGGKCDAGAPPSATNCPPLQPFQDPADQYKPFPTTLPSPLELATGDMYSGSPFLGSTGALPVGAGRLGMAGAYFHMMHSHNEREIINYGIFPGGMMTMIVIEPWSVTID
jgi:FtsP/CotA-like multicopper oxidase with cupredoxin domain